MAVKIKFSHKFRKQYHKAPAKIKIAFNRRLNLFLQNKLNPQLNNHSLTGKLKGYRSINVTGDWRAVFRKFESGKLVHFDLIGTHSQLYK